MKIKYYNYTDWFSSFREIGETIFLYQDDEIIGCKTYSSDRDLCKAKYIEENTGYVILEVDDSYYDKIKKFDKIEIIEKPKGESMKPFEKLFAKKDVTVKDKKTGQTKTVKKVNDNVGFVVGAVVGVGLAFLADKYL